MMFINVSCWSLNSCVLSSHTIISLLTSLGRDPKKVLDEVTERILVIIESHKCSKNVQEDI